MTPAPAVVLKARGMVGFVRHLVRSRTIDATPDRRIAVGLWGSIDQAEHLRVFHDIDVEASRTRVHQALHARGRTSVPHWHSVAVTAALEAAEAAERDRLDAIRRARAGLPPE